MKKVFDFACDKCGHEEDDVLHEEGATVRCKECGAKMRRRFTGCGKFTVKGKFTAKNSYGLKG